MYGLVIWLSHVTNSALLATDWGSHLTYVPSGTQKVDGLAVGDLVYIEGLAPGQQEFAQGLTLVWPGYNPTIKEFLANATMHRFVAAFSKTGNFRPQPMAATAVNQTVAPIAPHSRNCDLIQPDFG